MLRKIGLLFTVAACGALVTSCGGDDAPTPTPTPTDSGTATPTPTPTSGTIDFDLAADFTAQSTNTGAIYAYFTPTGGMETFNGASRINGNFLFDLVAATNSVTFSFADLSDPVIFENADLVSSSATELAFARGDEQLFAQLPFAHVLRVIYELDNQDFTRDGVAGTLRANRLALFFNLVTTTDDITANLTYTGTPLVAGGAPGTSEDDVSAPQVTFTVTPGTDDTITGTINVFEDINGVSTQVASFDFNATVGSNGAFTGDFEDQVYDLVGEYAGVLAGPNREELVILFAGANADDGRQFVGNFIGSQ